MSRTLVLVALLCLMLVGCKGSGAAGKYYINVQAKDAMPGADKIILTLDADGKMDLSAGPMSMLSGTWKQDGDKVTFSNGVGLIGTEYQVSGDKLLPYADGKPVSGWDFTRK